MPPRMQGGGDAATATGGSASGSTPRSSSRHRDWADIETTDSLGGASADAGSATEAVLRERLDIAVRSTRAHDLSLVLTLMDIDAQVTALWAMRNRSEDTATLIETLTRNLRVRQQHVQCGVLGTRCALSEHASRFRAVVRRV